MRNDGLVLRLLKRLWRILPARQRRRAFLLTGAVIIMACLEVANVSAIGPFLALATDPSMVEQNVVLSFLYQRFEFQDANTFLIVVGLGVFMLMLLSNGWSALTTWAQLRLAWSLNHYLSSQLLARYLRRPYTYFLSRNTADLSKNILSEVQEITNQMLRPLILAIGRGVVALGLIFLLVVTNPVLALLVTIVVGGTFGAVYASVRRKLGLIGRDRVKANSERFTVASEALGGIKDVKVLGVEDAFLRRFMEPSYKFARHQATSQAIAYVPRYAVETIAFGTVILIVVYLLAVNQSFGSIVPALGLYAFAGYRLLPALQEVFRAVTETRFRASALEAILEDLETGVGFSQAPHFAREKARAVVSCTQSQIGRIKRGVKLEAVRFSYPDADKPALNGVTLEIPVNSTIGIVGATGSGKTTLVDVILGLLRPQAGTILVDDIPITDENVADWQKMIGYVPQQIFLSDASVAENIAFGIPKEQIDMDAVRAAAKIAQIDDFITRELPHGYDTTVGERGIRLSGGQRQRIGIARALYRDPAVIVFDEATSALDNTTEEQLMQAMKSLLGRKTVIMIAHRVTTLEDCDHIYMLDGGRVVADGSYGELVRKQGAFAVVT